MPRYKAAASLTVAACPLLQQHWALPILHSSSSPHLRTFSWSTPRNSPILGVDLDTRNETVKVHFDNNVVREYPWLFLQDNCTCGACFHLSSRSRKRLMTNLDLKKRVTFVHVIDGDKIKCTWSDGHVGVLSQSWLEERCFSAENISKRKTYPRDNPQFTASIENMLRVDFKEVLRDSAKLLRLLAALCTQGVVLAENAPTTVGQLRKLVEKVGFIRTTHYGNEFTVKSEANASNLAYTSTTLCVHTDLPYYVYPPGVQLLHCIRQYGGDDGAYSHLVDGFLVADQMKQLHPQSYKILSEVPVEFADVGQDYTKFDKVHHSPTFVHSEKGNLTRIVYSNQQLSSALPVPLEKVKPLYEALKLFTTLCYDPKNLMRFKLNEGDVLIFDNWRMLHGREGFDPSKGGRHLEGCYIDWDEVYSTMRVIQNSSQ